LHNLKRGLSLPPVRLTVLALAATSAAQSLRGQQSLSTPALLQAAPAQAAPADPVRFAHLFAPLPAAAGASFSRSLTSPEIAEVASAPRIGPIPAQRETSDSSGPDAFRQESRPLPPHRQPVPEAGLYAKYILPGQRAPRLTPFSKIVIGFRDTLTPLAALGWVGEATFEQIIDGPPNYGETGRGYVQRIGAFAAHGASDSVFTAAVFAPVFHQDPRFYKQGHSHSVAERIAYSATRTFLTRTDGGRQTINLAQLTGNLAGAALTQAYYPPLNRGFRDFGHIYGVSLLGASVSYVFSEFLSDTLTILHLQSVKFL
jgi:hypothetical protein